MNLQSDLFGEPIAAIVPPADNPAPDSAALRTLAMPCGFMNNKNKPCRRPGSRAVMLDGSPLVCRNVSMVHCEPDCFRTDAIPANPYDENDIQWERPEV
ncbi:MULTISPECIES: hypothetical protein [unclassified Sphingomonas]|uniref:hypothetical protein n=1 Tax=unclassified Sphingomonas TaxID=196159 RepID=UPI00226A656E|nr:MULTISPECIES: hypothetical protein [unclassified Sphingomonas]